MAGRWLTRFARLPIRARLTFAFAAVLTAALAAAGAVLYVQFERDLDAGIDDALHAQAVDIADLAGARGGPGAVAGSGEQFAQIYARDGRVVASTAAASRLRLLTPQEARRAARRAFGIARLDLPAEDARVRAVPARRPGTSVAAVAVADSLERRDHALERLRTLLLIAGPLALLLASVAGYEVAGAALRPVDRMRARAEQITERHLAERLPVPETEDEIGALGRTLNALLGRVEQAVARERRLVSDASHELRTPLTTLRAEVDLALRGERDAGELRAALESASEEAQRMTRIADDLLVLARADQGRLPLHPAPIPVRDVLAEAADRADAAVRARGRAIVARDNTADGATVFADRDRIAQALDNLVTNALRHGHGTIVLAANSDGELIELHVTDEGEGLPEELIGRAFERFSRSDEARSGGEGSGLGLAIVEAVATAHSGRVGARNRRGGGGDVWIALPRG